MSDKFIAIPHARAFFLTDYVFWAQKEKELDEWCRENNCVHLGMTVEAKTDYGYFLFILKWS